VVKGVELVGGEWLKPAFRLGILGEEINESMKGTCNTRCSL